MITVVDYGMGNIGSIVNMIRKAGGEAQTSSDPRAIAAAEKLILPGVGAFDNGMKNLESLGLIDALNEAVRVRRAPVLGICLGMQLFTRGSEEGSVPGLGWIDATTVRFRFEPQDRQLKVPHMGWNVVRPVRTCEILQEMDEMPLFYFVHSYYVVCGESGCVAAVSTHGIEFASVIWKDNIFATQFHPEKSHKYGLKLIGNFVALTAARC